MVHHVEPLLIPLNFKQRSYSLFLGVDTKYAVSAPGVYPYPQIRIYRAMNYFLYSEYAYLQR
jgi:hypothetical protein